MEASRVPPPPPLSSLELYYGWEQERFMTLSKGAFSLAGLILSPLLAAILSNTGKVDLITAIQFGVGMLAACLSGAVMHGLAAEVEDEFISRADTYPS
jgi:hypothetical protein